MGGGTGELNGRNRGRQDFSSTVVVVTGKGGASSVSPARSLDNGKIATAPSTSSSSTTADGGGGSGSSRSSGRERLGLEFQFLVPISGTPIVSGIPIPFVMPKITVGFFFEIPMSGESENQNSDLRYLESR